MRKVTINYNPAGDIWGESPTGEYSVLYYPVEGVYGDYICTTGGYPVTLVDLEETQEGDPCKGLREAIDKLIEKSDEWPWEACDEADYAYVREWLELWGIETDGKEDEAE